MSEGQASSQETLSGFFSRGTSQIALILPLDPQLDFSGLHSAGILISTASFRETYPCCPQESSQVGARVSGAAEFHRRALSEPDVSLSAHPAPSIRLLA